jgi:peptidyl-prolyl cis-trans isomerase C
MGEEPLNISNGGPHMAHQKYLRTFFIVSCIITLIFIGCGSKEEKSGGATTEVQKPETQQAAPTPSIPSDSPMLTQSSDPGVIVNIDGTKLTKDQLDSDMKKRIAAIKKQVPADRLAQVRENIRNQIINDFVIRTLLTNEVNRLKISATESEVTEAIDRLKKNLPQGMTIEDIMKKNQISKEKMKEDIRFGIKVNKLVMSQPSATEKPTDKEIAEFYESNKEKFKMPESVRVRHILVAKAPGDDDKGKAGKKAKAEDLRKQVVAGADFAEVAKKNSDCPSKENGGDLGVFSRGEMVKPFEDAAFSQDLNAVGPIIETEFGFHIIQVLEKNAPKVISLDEKMKTNISTLLQQQKQQQAFETILKKLRAKSNIVVYKN